MFYCPVCKRQYKTDEAVAKCFLRCWKEQNPNHKSHEAPHSEDIVVRQINADTERFFAMFGGNTNES